MRMMPVHRLWLLNIGVLLSLVGCGGQRTLPIEPHFALLPPNPSSIMVTKYSQLPNSKHKTISSFTLTGFAMAPLYTAIQQDAKHVLPKQWSASCPSSTAGTVVCDYSIVIHYPDHANRSFTQTSDECTILTDEQTRAMAFPIQPYGHLPGLNPFQTGN